MTSRQIESNQLGPHSRLDEVVKKHLTTAFLRPIPDYSRQVFDQAFKLLDSFSGPLVFDSYCGVGESTVQLARAMPDAFIVGLDKSAHRLNKHADHYRQQGVDNYLLLRADTDDFWRLAHEANWRLSAHFIFYPNPWPKANQLQRRCHGSPLFPTLLKLGGNLELRSNWRLYLEEFAQAMQLAGQSAQLETWQANPPQTPFERKYANSGQTLWRLTCEIQ